jgi:hypothetical protein
MGYMNKANLLEEKYLASIANLPKFKDVVKKLILL